eukprot:209746-Pyramimonas_sp.AAC.1
MVIGFPKRDVASASWNNFRTHSSLAIFWEPSAYRFNPCSRSALFPSYPILRFNTFNRDVRDVLACLLSVPTFELGLATTKLSSYFVPNPSTLSELLNRDLPPLPLLVFLIVLNPHLHLLLGL